MSRQRGKTQGARLLVVSTRLTDREQRALTVVGLARGVATGNVVREMSIHEALEVYDRILEVVRPEFEGTGNGGKEP